jgi:hypothetical protein
VAVVVTNDRQHHCTSWKGVILQTTPPTFCLPVTVHLGSRSESAFGKQAMFVESGGKINWNQYVLKLYPGQQPAFRAK